MHNISIQNMLVGIILYHSRLVGNYVPTHHICYDMAYLGCIPNLKIMALSDDMEMNNMVSTCAAFNNGPIVL